MAALPSLKEILDVSSIDGFVFLGLGVNALAGRDSGILSANGWNYQYSVYAGYDGSQQRYSSNSIHQNGGIIGVTGAWYKNNFFTSLTADAGMSFANARTMYGSEKFKTVNAGIASKSGYNWMLAAFILSLVRCMPSTSHRVLKPLITLPTVSSLMLRLLWSGIFWIKPSLRLKMLKCRK